MHNWVKLNEEVNQYEVFYNGQTHYCDRVTSLLEQTRPIPYQLLRWMTNCAVTDIFSKLASNPDWLARNVLDNELQELREVAWQAHKKEQTIALESGSEAHQAIHSHWTQQPPSWKSAEAKKAHEGFCAFVKDHSLTPLVQELTLYNLKLKIAGTLDLIGLLSGVNGLILLDWKTSKAIGREYKIQVCIYKYMLIEFLKLYRKNPTNYDPDTQAKMNLILSHMGKRINLRCGIVKINKKANNRTPYKFVEVSDKEYRYYLKEFEFACKLYNHRKKENETCPIS